MEVLKEGIKKDEYGYIGKCKVCRTIFECSRESFFDSVGTVNCPLCTRNVYSYNKDGKKGLKLLEEIK
jgi:hypothetical protein